jgi:nitroreductase
MTVAVGEAVSDAVRECDPMPAAENDYGRHIEAGIRNRFAHMGEAPLTILICGRSCYPHNSPDERFLWSAMGVAVQNMLLAARSIGIGMASRVLHLLAESRIREIVGLPDDRVIGYTAVVGLSQRRFRPLNRRPIDEVVHRNGW